MPLIVNVYTKRCGDNKRRCNGVCYDCVDLKFRVLPCHIVMTIYANAFLLVLFKWRVVNLCCSEIFLNLRKLSNLFKRDISDIRRDSYKARYGRRFKTNTVTVNNMFPYLFLTHHMCNDALCRLLRSQYTVRPKLDVNISSFLHPVIVKFPFR